MIVIQGLLAIYEHNLIHAFERWMSVVLGIVFAIATVTSGIHAVDIPVGTSTSHPTAIAASVMAVAFSYIASWSPYGSDYSR